MNGEKFRLTVGGHPSFSFRTTAGAINDVSHDFIEVRRYVAGDVTPSSPLAPTTITRCQPTDRDVQIAILFCGVRHSDVHTARNEWSEFGGTIYPVVPAG